MGSHEVIRALKRLGFQYLRSRGSHAIFQRPDGRGIVVVPHPERDLPVGTLKAIERQAGVKLRR